MSYDTLFTKQPQCPYCGHHERDAHKHRLLVSWVTQDELNGIDKKCQVLFQKRRDKATKQRECLREQIAELEAYWPHLTKSIDGIS